MTFKKIKSESTDLPQLSIISRELENLKSKSDLSALKDISIADLTNPEIQSRGFTDGVQYVYELIKKIFTYLNNNSEEIKKIILDLQTVVVELKDMYAQLEIKQTETETKQQMLYEKSLPKSEQKKLEEERKKKAEEEKKLEEDRKKKAEEIQKQLDAINAISAFCGADIANDPDMKDILSMYGSLKPEEEKEKE